MHGDLGCGRGRAGRRCTCLEGKKKAEEGLNETYWAETVEAIEKELAHAVEGREALMAKQQAIAWRFGSPGDEGADVIDIG